MYRSFLLIALTMAVLTGGVVGLSQSKFRQDPDGRQSPVLRPDGTLMLSVLIDADGVEVFLVTKKPELEFRRPKNWDRLSFRWQMFSKGGSLLVEGGFDPGPMDLAPENKGKFGHIHGDQLIPTETSMNVKVPAFGNIGRITFTRRDRSSGQTVQMGSVAASNLRAR